MLSERDRLALEEIEHHLNGDDQLVGVFATLTGAPRSARAGQVSVASAVGWAAVTINVLAIAALWWIAFTIAPEVLFVVVPLTVTLLVVAVAALATTHHRARAGHDGSETPGI